MRRDIASRDVGICLTERSPWGQTDHRLQRRTLADPEHLLIRQFWEGQYDRLWWDLKYLYVFLRNNCWGRLPCNTWVDNFVKKVGAIADVQGPPAELSPYAADTFTWIVSMWGDASDLNGKHRSLMVNGVEVLS